MLERWNLAQLMSKMSVNTMVVHWSIWVIHLRYRAIFSLEQSPLVELNSAQKEASRQKLESFDRSSEDDHNRSKVGVGWFWYIGGSGILSPIKCAGCADLCHPFHSLNADGITQSTKKSLMPKSHILNSFIAIQTSTDLEMMTSVWILSQLIGWDCSQFGALQTRRGFVVKNQNNLKIYPIH